jgi:hypothetical protein
MNIDSGEDRLVLFCPALKQWRTAGAVKLGTVIRHCRADVMAFANREELICTSGLPASALVEVGDDHGWPTRSR